MIAPLLLLLASAPDPAQAAAAGVAGSPLGTIPRQQLPATGCAAYLWTLGERHDLVAMAGAASARLRVAIGGHMVDLPRSDGPGAGASFGFAGETRYAGEGLEVVLAMTVTADPSLTQGATVPEGTLTISRTGEDAVVLPVAGLIGCAPAPAGG